jgi:hypothetical protein
MPEVDPQKTQLSKVQLRAALLEGHQIAFGYGPSDGRLGYAWSVATLETGGAGWNYNLGNIKATPSWKEADNLWTTIPVPPPEPPEQRAYESPEAGAADWWRLLDKPRYDGVLELADTGAAYDAAYLMGERGYYTAPKDEYSELIQKLYDQYCSYWPAPIEPPPVLGAETESILGRVSAMLFGGAVGWWTAWRARHRKRPRK